MNEACKKKYNANGNLRSEIWFSDDKTMIHRNDGPARIVYDDGGEIEEKLWFWRDKIYSFDKWIELADGPKATLVELKLTYGNQKDGG